MNKHGRCRFGKIFLIRFSQMIKGLSSPFRFTHFASRVWIPIWKSSILLVFCSVLFKTVQPDQFDNFIYNRLSSRFWIELFVCEYFLSKYMSRLVFSAEIQWGICHELWVKVRVSVQGCIWKRLGQLKSMFRLTLSTCNKLRVLILYRFLQRFPSAI